MWQQHAADIGGIFCYARAVLAKWGTPAGAGAPVAPDFYTACAWYEGGGEAGWIPLPGYSNETEHGVRHLVLEAARKEGYKGTAAGRLLELGWEIRPVHLTPQPAQTQAGAGARSCGCEASPGPCLLQHQGVTGASVRRNLDAHTVKWRNRPTVR